MDAESLHGWVSCWSTDSQSTAFAALTLGWEREAPAAPLEQGWGGWGALCSAVLQFAETASTPWSPSAFPAFVLTPACSPWGWDQGCDILKIPDAIMNSFICTCLYLLQWGIALLSPFFSYLMLPLAFLSVLVTLSDTLSACAALSSWKLIIAICLWADCPFILCHSIFHGSSE